MNAVDLARELISIPSTLGKTTDIENFVAGQLAPLVDVEFIEVPGKGRNVLARSIVNDQKPTIIFNGHLDTVEVCNGWTKDPFKPVIEGDRMYGLGTADMKGGVAIAMLAFQEAVKKGINAIFVGTIDEEGDSAGGFAIKDLGLKADLCLITEPSNEKIMLGCRGRYVMDVNVSGRSAHGAVPEKGVNAITEAGRLLSRLDELPLIDHDVLGKGSVCPLSVDGGTTTLSVPEECRIVIDRHVVPGETKESVMQDIRDLAGKIGSQAAFDVALSQERPTPFLEPYITSDNNLVSQFQDTVKGDIAYGKSVGDYNIFATMCPTIVHGPVGESWHSPDEWVSISSIENVMGNYIRFLDTFQS